MLLLRFLRNLRTSRGPSWPFLFLSLEFCFIFVILATLAVFASECLTKFSSESFFFG